MSATTLRFEPLNATFGARVSGVRLADIDERTFHALYEAWLEYALLVFSDQFMTRPQQVKFAQRFGPLEFDIAALSNVLEDGSLRPDDGTDDVMKVLKGNMGWHHDSTYMPVQAKGAVFTAEVVPPTGGATGFADMRAAYDALDERTKSGINDLVCEHSLLFSRGRLGFDELSDEEKKNFKPALQTLVRIHPETGRRSLFLSAHAGGIIGWTRPRLCEKSNF